MTWPLRTTPEWIGATPDTRPPPHVRMRVLCRYHGRCAKCTRDLKQNRWDCDHIVALCNGGLNVESNLRPLCITPCHSDKTLADRRIKTTADRAQKRDFGIRKPRTITRWRNMRGEIVEAPRER